jgi:ABC-type sugar transport system ATPase subunit
MEVSEMPNIYLHNISTSYCLNKVNLKIEEGEFIVILGSTGAGKSTLLNVIAGLTEYDGEVYFNGKNMNDVPTERRDLGYLIQDIYLFPHMDVYKNIAFPLRAASCSADKTAEKVEAILELFNIS